MEGFFTEHSVLITGLASFIAITLGLLKYRHSVFNTNRTFKINSLELLHKTMTDTINPSTKLIVEQVFLNQFRVKIDYEIIKKILSHHSPSHSINLYKSSAYYFESKNGEITFKDKFNSEKKRNRENLLRPIISFVQYVIFAVIGAFCFIIAKEYFTLDTLTNIRHGTYNFVWLTCLLVTGALFIFFAFLSLFDERSIRKAEELELLFHTPKPKSILWNC